MKMPQPLQNGVRLCNSLPDGARKSLIQNGTESLTLQITNVQLSLPAFYFTPYKEGVLWGWFRLAPLLLLSWICEKFRVISTERFPSSAREDCCRHWFVLSTGQPPGFFRHWICVYSGSYRTRDHMVLFYNSSLSNNSVGISYRNRWGCSIYSTTTQHLLQCYTDKVIIHLILIFLLFHISMKNPPSCLRLTKKKINSYCPKREAAGQGIVGDG